MPDAVVRHMGSAITGKGSDFSVYYAQRNIVWTYLRNMPGHYVWLYLPAHIAINLASVAQFIRKGQGRVVLKAKWDALKGVPRSIQERRAIQRTRAVAPGDVLAPMERGNVFGTLARRALRVLRPARG